MKISTPPPPGLNRVKEKLLPSKNLNKENGHQTEIPDINGGYCFRFFEASEEIIQPLARMITAESEYSKFDFQFENRYIGLVYLLPRFLCLLVFAVIVFIMTAKMPVKPNTIVGDYIIPIISHLKKDGTIIDIFLMSCLNSIFVVLGSQLFLKGLLETFDIKLYTIAVSYGMGFKLDCISEICFLLSYLSMRNIYVF